MYMVQNVTIQTVEYGQTQNTENLYYTHNFDLSNGKIRTSFKITVNSFSCSSGLNLPVRK